MSKLPVLTKKEMYVRLMAGEFGNSLERFFNVDEWLASPTGANKYELWGVQSTAVANDPRARLDTPSNEVLPHLIKTGLLRDGYSLTVMGHQIGNVQWEGQVEQSPVDFRWHAEGMRNPPLGSWRKHMLKPTEWRGTAMRILLREILNENSYEDIIQLIEDYPGHAIEFTAYDACFGTVPNRNAVMWEVRKY